MNFNTYKNKRHSKEAQHKMTQILDSVGEILKADIINIFQEVKGMCAKN